MTIGFMTKGIPSIAFQGLTIIGFALYYRKWIYFIHPSNFVFSSSKLGSRADSHGDLTETAVDRMWESAQWAGIVLPVSDDKVHRAT